MPKVSVIIPVYNGERFIAQAVNSVLGQTFRDFELIVVDDGSTDRTPDILKKYGSRLTYIGQPNRERSAARNTGIRHSEGEYLAFLDADDLCLPERLQRQVEILDQFPEVGLVHGWTYFIDETGQKATIGKKEMLSSLESGARVFESLLFKNVIASPTVMIRRSCIDTVGFFDESLTYVEDWDMWLRIAIQYHVALIPEPLACYRINSENLLEAWRRYDVPRGRMRVVQKACSSLKGRPDLWVLKRRALLYSYWWSAVTSYRMGYISQARKYSLNALLRFPILASRYDPGTWVEIMAGRSVLNVLRYVKRSLD
jgi:glycosyltransferase involved in cell wall biosynthesis